LTGYFIHHLTDYLPCFFAEVIDQLGRVFGLEYAIDLLTLLTQGILIGISTGVIYLFVGEAVDDRIAPDYTGEIIIIFRRWLTMSIFPRLTLFQKRLIVLPE
jgi:hypothetical protein